MFYSTELLSLRRKGKLARCWLAAIFNEKMFKKTCRSTLIKRIDVVVICEEILSTIEIPGGRRNGRFSLYLCSQLMYGVTKILFYQTKFLQDYLFKINWKLFHASSSKSEFSKVFDLEVPEVAPVTEVFRNLEESTNLHLITDEPYTSVIEHMMQDVMNFGVLPNHEMEKFILPEAEEISLSDIRRFCWDESIEIPAESVQVPLADVNKFEIETIDKETETRFALSKKQQRESLIVVEEYQIAKHIPTTSRKRILRSPTETIPRKRSKVSCIEESAVPLPLEPLQMPVPEKGLMFEPVLAPELACELQQATAPDLNNIELRTKPKSRRERRLLDKHIKLSDFIMRKCIENVAAHTIESYRYLPNFPPAAEYLQQPSTKILKRLWGQTLLKLFNQHLITPFNVEDEFQNVYAFEIEDAIVGEIIRADTSTKLPDQTSELSSKIGFTVIETTDTSKTLEKMFPMEDYQARASGQIKQAKESEELLVRLPEITGFEEDIGEGTNILEITLDEKKLKNTPECTFSFSSKARLTKIELLTLMQIRWRTERLIKFCELISPENYSKIDAACAFQYCLEFEAERTVILKQAEPFDTIWVERYPYYTTESSEDNAAI